MLAWAKLIARFIERTMWFWFAAGFLFALYKFGPPPMEALRWLGDFFKSLPH